MSTKAKIEADWDDMASFLGREKFRDSAYLFAGTHVDQDRDNNGQRPAEQIHFDRYEEGREYYFLVAGGTLGEEPEGWWPEGRPPAELDGATWPIKTNFPAPGHAEMQETWTAFERQMARRGVKVSVGGPVRVSVRASLPVWGSPKDTGSYTFHFVGSAWKVYPA